MGKKRIALVDESGEITTKNKKRKKEERQKTKITGSKGGGRIVDMSVLPDETGDGKRETDETGDGKTEKQKEIAKARVIRVRGKTYQAARTKIDPTKTYSPEEAISLVKQVSFSRFDGNVDIHISTHKKGLTGEVKLPHFKGKTKKVVVVDDKVLKAIKIGKFDFDILLATKEFMPKLVPFAKVLGPKGLLPNPKKGTLVDDPQKALEKFKTSAIRFETEKKYPLIHITIGKISQSEKELLANFQALITAINPKNIKKMVICPTMGPGVRVQTLA